MIEKSTFDTTLEALTTWKQMVRRKKGRRPEGVAVVRVGVGLAVGAEVAQQQWQQHGTQVWPCCPPGGAQCLSAVPVPTGVRELTSACLSDQLAHCPPCRRSTALRRRQPLACPLATAPSFAQRQSGMRCSGVCVYGASWRHSWC
jgi:hypothetical protein